MRLISLLPILLLLACQQTPPEAPVVPVVPSNPHIMPNGGGYPVPLDSGFTAYCQMHPTEKLCRR